jgi:hypothetical protein
MGNESQKEFFIETQEGRDLVKEEIKNADRPIRVLSLFYPKEADMDGSIPEAVDFVDLLKPAIEYIDELEQSILMIQSHLDKVEEQTESFRQSREILIKQLKKVYRNIERELDKLDLQGDED